MRHFRFIVLLLAISLAPFGAAVAQTNLKVGFIGGFSGPGKAYGVASRNGFEMGLEKAHSSRLTVVYEDDEFTPAKTVTAFKKLTEIDRIDVAVVLASSPSKAIAPLAEQKRLPLIAWASDREVAKNRKYVFRSWVSGDDEGARIAAESVRRKYPPLAFLITTSDYTRSVRDGLKLHLPAALLAHDDEYPADARDFKPFLLSLRKKRISHLGICLQPGQPGILAKQAKEVGLNLSYFGCETLHDNNEIALSQGALVGSWFVTGAVSDDFYAAYLKRFGNDDVISGAAVHHDAATMLAAIAEQISDPKQVAGKLREAKVSAGALGTFDVVATADDQYFNIQLMLKETTANGFRTLKD